jgi:hypothetical protein
MTTTDIIIFVIGALLGFGPTMLKVQSLRKLVQGAAKYLDGLSDPNPQIRQDAIAKGVTEVATIIDKYIPNK